MKKTIYFGVVLGNLLVALLSACSQRTQVTETDGRDPLPATPVTWPTLIQINELTEEMLAHENPALLTDAWLILSGAATHIVTDLPVRAMNPIGAKSAAERVVSVATQEREFDKAMLTALQTALEDASNTSGVPLDPHANCVGDNHDHGHNSTLEGPHHGIKTAGKNPAGETAAWIEVKVHPEDGTVEAWLFEDEKCQIPLDLPTDTTLSASYIVSGKTLSLSVRDTETNKDTTGYPNVRDGKTNYFAGQHGVEGNIIVSLNDGSSELRTAFFNLAETH